MESFQNNTIPESPSLLTKDDLRAAWREERNGILSVAGSFGKISVHELQEPLRVQSICMNYDSFYDAVNCKLHGAPLEQLSSGGTTVYNNYNTTSNVPSLCANEYPIVTGSVTQGDECGNILEHVDSLNQMALEDIIKGTEASPDEIHTLILNGPVPLGITIGLASKFKTLQKLYIHFASLNEVKLGDLSGSAFVMELPLLQNFTVAATGIDEGIFSLREHTREFNPCYYLDFLSMFSVLNGILNRNHFVQLKSLIMDVPYCSERENTFVTALGGFIARHKDTLEDLCYHQGFIVKCTPSPEEMASREIDNKIDENGNLIIDDDHVSMTRLSLNAAGLKPLRKLKNIHINLASQQESDPLWKNFILTQEAVERFIFTGESRIPFPCHTLRDSARTLTTIIVEIRDDVDLECLQNCSLLKKLYIMGKPHEDDEQEIEMDFSPMDASDDPNVYNVTKLPRSLETISLRHMNIMKEDVDYILLSGGIPHLKEFELIGGGTKGGFGISCTTMACVWEARKLERFGFKSSLNKLSLKEKALIPESVKFMALILEENVSLTNFKVFMRKNSSGQYTWDKRDEILYTEWLYRSIFEFPETTRPGFEEGYACYKDLNYKEEEEEDSSTSSDDDDYETISGAASDADGDETGGGTDDDGEASSSEKD